AFDLQRRERQRAGSLSGGEQQRVAIAAAAAREAPLVLADEPTAELDARNEQAVLRALRRLRDEFASTVIAVTHSPRVADAVDRVIELRAGRLAWRRGRCYGRRSRPAATSRSSSATEKRRCARSTASRSSSAAASGRRGWAAPAPARRRS